MKPFPKTHVSFEAADGRIFRVPVAQLCLEGPPGAEGVYIVSTAATGRVTVFEDEYAALAGVVDAEVPYPWHPDFEKQVAEADGDLS